MDSKVMLERWQSFVAEISNPESAFNDADTRAVFMRAYTTGYADGVADAHRKTTPENPDELNNG